MSIRFLTDSTADILPQEAAQRGIDVVPLKVLFGDTAYRDGVDLDHSAFYQMLQSAEKLPTTSQPTPEDFLPFFDSARSQGDTLICLLLASTLSGTCQSALIARDICGYDQIHIIDSTVSITALRLLVDLGCMLRDQALPAEAIVAELEQAKGKIRLLAVVDTLEYLHKGGRLPAAATVVGGLLKVKPLLTLKDGTLSVVGKGMGVKGSLNALMELVGNHLNNDPRLPIYYGYTGSDELCRQFIGRMEETFGSHSYEIHPVGSVIGAHAGPGAAVIVYLEQ